ncbi:putative NmrA-like family protein [Aspergillus ibericus CBS 121593]|uniref:NAD(P)-binding protein n=1 Tax=Aspergillus ibericus CBS 121593 TaxID=1448316 RepID=A0A395HAG4_9EURO|nr:NAD(P)-binding protein [Aspergillus ibericus CBS 121593]RAL04680.1 NAD(P)-binding protein [Aspergillus ibericus CBS 121593]
MSLKYLLTGSTGGLGAQILSYFTSHPNLISPADFAASSSNPANRSKFESQGIQFRVVNYDDPDTLEVAFQGVENLLFVSTNTFDVEKRRRQHGNVVDVAGRVGVKHIWYTSLAFGGFDSTSQASVQQAHYMTEEMLRASGIPYTSLREGIYTECFPLFLNWYPSTKTIYLPTAASTGRIAFTLRSELAEATARLLLRGASSQNGNGIVLLTAKESISVNEIVEVINETTGRDVTVEYVDAEEYVRIHAESDEGGKSEGFFRQLVGWFEGIEKGELEVTHGLMAEVLGREAIGAREAIRGLLSRERDYVWHQNYAN